MIKLQELTQLGKLRNVPPREMTLDQWERLKKTKVGKKRFRLLKEDRKDPQAKKEVKPKKLNDE